MNNTISYNDIEVFIASYNRPTLIAQTIESILNQSIKGFRIAVLDNCSNEETIAVIKKFKNRNVELFENPRNVGVIENLSRVKCIAKKEWIILFHDDDLMHPCYIQTIIDTLNQCNNKDKVSVIASCMTPQQFPNNTEWDQNQGNFVYYNKAKQFVADIYSKYGIHFGSVVYKKDFFLKANFHPEIFGKAWDFPFVFDIADCGSPIILTEKWTKYRIHEMQDGKCLQTGPFLQEALNLHKLFRQILGSNIYTKTGLVFNLKNYINLKMMLDSIGYPMKSHWSNALKEGAMTWLSFLMGISIFYAKLFLRTKTTK
jgi:glycosyltransferase involved in cell wall biosynthesis